MTNSMLYYVSIQSISTYSVSYINGFIEVPSYNYEGAP